jgi:ATP-dependent helicase/nuclease subunit A
LFPLADEEAPEIVKQAKLKAEAESLREHRRLFYVALTRARDRLYVCGFESKKGVKDGSWYELARTAAQSLGVAVTQGDGEIIAYGTTQEEKGSALRAEQKQNVLPSWTRTRPSIELDLPRLIQPSDAIGVPPASFSPAGEGRFQRGLVVHALLAGLPEIPADKRRALALAFVAQKGLKDARELVEEVLAVIEGPSFAAAFGPNSQSEAGLLAELPELGPGARVNGRIDRLAITDKEVLILDYKTNRPPPESEAQVPKVYLAQMALYRAAAAKVFSGRRIVCGLVFTDGPRLLQLSDVVLDAQMAEISAHLDQNGVRS